MDQIIRIGSHTLTPDQEQIVVNALLQDFWAKSRMMDQTKASAVSEIIENIRVMRLQRDTTG